jgi:hypothetical protein
MLFAGTLPPSVALTELLALVIAPAVAVLLSASVFSRSSAERRAGLLLGIIGAVAPIAAMRFSSRDTPPNVPARANVSDRLPHRGLSPLLAIGCVGAIDSVVAALGAAIGVWTRRLFGRLLARRKDRLPDQATAQHAAADVPRNSHGPG